MRGRLLAAVCFLFASALSAQTPATTADGRAVMLYDNGTWKFAAATAPDTAPDTGSVLPVVKDAITVLDGRMVLRYDPSRWRETSTETPGKILLTHMKGDGLAMIIAERFETDVDTLVRIALDNARSASPDVQIVSRKHLRVNGIDVVEMRFTGTLRGIPFTYLGHYYSGPEGSVQLLTFTGTGLFAEYEADFRDLLSGLEKKE